jgi:hypothetical protein
LRFAIVRVALAPSAAAGSIPSSSGSPNRSGYTDPMQLVMTIWRKGAAKTAPTTSTDHRRRLIASANPKTAKPISRGAERTVQSIM